MFSVIKGENMTINLNVENANEDLIKAFKNMAKASGANLKIK